MHFGTVGSAAFCVADVHGTKATCSQDSDSGEDDEGSHKAPTTVSRASALYELPSQKRREWSHRHRSYL